MTKFNKQILFLLIILLVFGILVVFIFDVDCILKKILHIPCPGCGLTRGFKALLKGNILLAFNYNILTIPICIFLLTTVTLLIIDYIQKEKYLQKFFLTLKKNYIFIIIILIINSITNIIKIV